MALDRRTFLTLTSAAVSAGSVGLAQSGTESRPNILWITCEDMSPNLGCYGDKFADSPTIDALATRSLRYRTCWSNAPVCAPARTTIISGMYPPSTGSEHMRSETKLAPGQKMFPQILREQAGYYTSNNSKEDYNIVHTGKVWDESSNKAHFRNRPSKDQPFFSVFNFVITHESQIRKTPHQLQHDLREVRIPAFYPDTPEVRHDWAQYYDNIKTMDGMVKSVLDQLAADGLADSTIVFFYSDHGAGMPRFKRWPYDSGLHVPFMVHFPEKFRHLAPKDYRPGGWTERKISFVDLAPTVLSLAGLSKEPYHQGIAFLGTKTEPAASYLFGFRGRMDERIDMVRSVRDDRYVYIRNFMPHRVYGQHLSYMFEMPTVRKWKELYDAGKLNAAQSAFWKTKPAEELYDLQSDPDEVQNLAASPTAGHKRILERLRGQLMAKALEIRDIGFLPEAEMHQRSKSDAPYSMGHDAARYDAKAVQNAAFHSEAATLTDADAAVRYWAATGFLIRGEGAVKANLQALRKALSDASANVRIVAAECLARYSGGDDAREAIELLLREANCEVTSNYVATAALNALSEIGLDKLKPYRDRIVALPKDNRNEATRAQGYVPRLLEYLQTRM
ncbi:sulfatase [Bryobacterales bacterium F-183]|nr:sulfatase [Bryobacterales bacterium F-183]